MELENDTTGSLKEQCAQGSNIHDKGHPQRGKNPAQVALEEMIGEESVKELLLRLQEKPSKKNSKGDVRALEFFRKRLTPKRMGTPYKFGCGPIKSCSDVRKAILTIEAKMRRGEIPSKEGKGGLRVFNMIKSMVE